MLTSTFSGTPGWITQSALSPPAASMAAAFSSALRMSGLRFTGGTTGTSKGVMLTHSNLMANAVHTQLAQPIEAHDRYLTMAPMFHAAGVYSALILPLRDRPRADAEALGSYGGTAGYKFSSI